MPRRAVGSGTEQDAQRWIGAVSAVAQRCVADSAKVRRLTKSTDTCLHLSVTHGKRSMGIQIDGFGFCSPVVLELASRLLAERLPDATWRGLGINASGLAEEEALLEEERINIDHYP